MKAAFDTSLNACSFYDKWPVLTINGPQLTLILFEAECSFYDKWPVLTINDRN